LSLEDLELFQFAKPLAFTEEPRKPSRETVRVRVKRKTQRLELRPQASKRSTTIRQTDRQTEQNIGGGRNFKDE
jgi:hypothetical protein